MHFAIITSVGDPKVHHVHSNKKHVKSGVFSDLVDLGNFSEDPEKPGHTQRRPVVARQSQHRHSPLQFDRSVGPSSVECLRQNTRADGNGIQSTWPSVEIIFFKKGGNWKNCDSKRCFFANPILLGVFRSQSQPPYGRMRGHVDQQGWCIHTLMQILGC